VNEIGTNNRELVVSVRAAFTRLSQDKQASRLRLVPARRFGCSPFQRASHLGFSHLDSLAEADWRKSR
jgi:hypothetical protein